MPDIYGSEVYFDTPRQTSKCRILIYSHISLGTDDPQFEGAVNCSRDVIDCAVSKTIKSGGGTNFTLVPRRNYMNYIYPNDYVYVYFDPGDGRGYILTFFGFVDRIERMISTGANGETTTRYIVTCSDFTKAFDKTNIYFNPHIVDRGDFASQFFAGTKNLAGSALRTKGVSIYGSPADVVLSLAERLLGFGAQFSVPASHPDIGARKDESRRIRWKNLLTMLKVDYLDFTCPEELEIWRRQVLDEMARLTTAMSTQVFGPAQAHLMEEGPAGAPTYQHMRETPVSLRVSALLSEKGYSYSSLEEMANYIEAYNVASDPNAGFAIEEGKLINNPYGAKLSLLDLIDFRFVEYGAMSGAILSAQIWQSQGSLWSIMNSWSNDLVNELFCDLRPVGANEKFDLRSGGYSKEPDTFRANEGGVVFIPAIVMREYPFATIEAVVPSLPVQILGTPLGAVPIGGFGDTGIWAMDANISGRKIAHITRLNPWLEKDKMADKHLDVVAISVKDIITERIGRSDSDVVNLIEVYADMGMGELGKYMDNDVQPISNPISIMRDGLRVRTYTSKFARWPAEKLGKSGLDDPGSRFQTIRWALLLDHWYQHSKEYLNGSITTRAFPEIRVGYRLDIVERSESYYVEGVSHQWTFTEKGGMLISSFTLSRGQRNDPYPVYVLPSLEGWGGLDNRGKWSRLAVYFGQKNPHATAASSILFGDSNVRTDDYLQNYTDIPLPNNNWSKTRSVGVGYLSAGSTMKSMEMREKSEALELLREMVDKKMANYLGKNGPSSPKGGIGK